MLDLLGLWIPMITLVLAGGALIVHAERCERRHRASRPREWPPEHS